MWNFYVAILDDESCYRLQTSTYTKMATVEFQSTRNSQDTHYRNLQTPSTTLYGRQVWIEIRNLEKITVKIERRAADLDFLKHCRDFNLIPPFACGGLLTTPQHLKQLVDGSQRDVISSSSIDTSFLFSAKNADSKLQNINADRRPCMGTEDAGSGIILNAYQQSNAASRILNTVSSKSVSSSIGKPLSDQVNQRSVIGEDYSITSVSSTHISAENLDNELQKVIEEDAVKIMHISANNAGRKQVVNIAPGNRTTYPEIPL